MNSGIMILVGIIVAIVVISILPPGITILAVLTFLAGKAIRETY